MGLRAKQGDRVDDVGLRNVGMTAVWLVVHVVSSAVIKSSIKLLVSFIDQSSSIVETY